jgi:beta-N-acetylhexosaminidase
MATFGVLYEQDKQAAYTQAEQCGYEMASELLTAGIDLSLSPVLDLNKSVSSVIGDRAFHADPRVVTDLSEVFIRGMTKAGMAAVGKHFPGHGSVTADSHLALPIDHRSLSDIEQADLKPFAELIKKGIPALMSAHIVFPQIDRVPVGYSHVWLKDILRKRLGFAGTVLSDDLSMEGANISTNYDDRVRAAREAGCDFTLVCNNRMGVVQALDRLPAAQFQVEEAKWRRLERKTPRNNS